MHFSIITITKNNPYGFEKTQKSVQSQTYKNYEWIVIDGDKEPDNGIYDAMNKGIARASGEYLIFMNAGDIFSCDGFLQKLSQYNADFIYGDANEGKFLKPSKHHMRMGEGMITHHQAMIYRRSVVDELRYDDAYPIAADYKFTIQYFLKCRSFLKLNMAICDYEIGGISQKNAAKARAEQVEIRSEFEMREPLTFYRQWCAQIIRRFCPNLYYKIRKRFY